MIEVGEGSFHCCQQLSYILCILPGVPTHVSYGLTDSTKWYHITFLTLVLILIPRLPSALGVLALHYQNVPWMFMLLHLCSLRATDLQLLSPHISRVRTQIFFQVQFSVIYLGGFL